MDQNTPTPRRRLGLSRISPRTTITPPVKRTINKITSAKSTTQNVGVENASQINDDFDSLITPTKKRKVSLGRFVFASKQTNDTNTQTSECEVTTKTVDELKAEISQMQAHLNMYEKYKVETTDLEQSIETWINGGRQALKMLQEQVQPKQELEQILTHLNIPIDIFGDVTNEE